MSAAADICVVHLVWAPLGPDPLRAFLDSYRRHPAGVDHRLLVVFNGFSSPEQGAPFLKLLDDLEHSTLWLPQPVQDIAAYLCAAESRPERRVCFLNSYSVIRGSDWLHKMSQHVDRRTPLVGASGSWESVLSSRQRWHRQNPRPGWRAWRDRQWEMFFARRHFPPFPNPHLRTNAFLIERELLLSLGFADVLAKDKAHRFESGRHSLTARVLRAGFDVRVVDAQGRAWRRDEWPATHTFRSGDQENLLVADNRTRQYQDALPAERREASFLAWGGKEPA